MNENLGKRITEYYENIQRTKLVRKTPVIIRLRVGGLSGFKKKVKNPFDAIFTEAMQETALSLCEKIQGCVLGYTNSDEISLLLTDYKKPESGAWFDYNVQKLSSASASMATLAFNRSFAHLANSHYLDCCWDPDNDQFADHIRPDSVEEAKYCEEVYFKANNKAIFTAKVFNIPKEEIVNYFAWRQGKGMSESIHRLGRSHFKHRELEYKTREDVIEMLKTKGIDWKGLPWHIRAGACIIRMGVDEGVKDRGKWTIDKNIPVFKNEGQEYIDQAI